jgi:hypothetical protein
VFDGVPKLPEMREDEADAIDLPLKNFFSIPYFGASSRWLVCCTFHCCRKYALALLCLKSVCLPSLVFSLRAAAEPLSPFYQAIELCGLVCDNRNRFLPTECLNLRNKIKEKTCESRGYSNLVISYFF